MTDDDFFLGWIWLGSCILMIAIGGFIGGEIVRDTVRASAIENGVGKYVVNEKTGHVDFEWIPVSESSDE